MLMNARLPVAPCVRVISRTRLSTRARELSFGTAEREHKRTLAPRLFSRNACAGVLGFAAGAANQNCSQMPAVASISQNSRHRAQSRSRTTVCE